MLAYMIKTLNLPGKQWPRVKQLEIILTCILLEKEEKGFPCALEFSIEFRDKQMTFY